MMETFALGVITGVLIVQTAYLMKIHKLLAKVNTNG